jgi:rRNA-processing protein FCF1
MDREVLEKELTEIQQKRIALEADLKQCKEVHNDFVEKETIEKELKKLARRAKRILFKLGRYRYAEDEMVEYKPGERISANIYHWLIDD